MIEVTKKQYFYLISKETDKGNINKLVDTDTFNKYDLDKLFKIKKTWNLQKKKSKS